MTSSSEKRSGLELNPEPLGSVSTTWTPPQPRLKKAESFLFYIPLYPDIVTEPFTIFFTMYHNDTFSFYVYRLSFTMRFHFFHFLDEGFDLILDYENKFFSLFPVIFGKVITGHIALMPQVKLIFCLQRPCNSNNNNSNNSSSSISKHGLNEEKQQQPQKKEERRGRDRERERERDT